MIEQTEIQEHYYGKKLNTNLINNKGEIIIPAYRKITKTLLKKAAQSGCVIHPSKIHIPIKCKYIRTLQTKADIAELEKIDPEIARRYASAKYQAFKMLIQVKRARRAERNARINEQFALDQLNLLNQKITEKALEL